MFLKIYSDQICAGAIERNLAKINQALFYVSLNVIVDFFKTPAFILASEYTPESKDALEFLITSYPTERLTLLKEAAAGYAFVGHLQAKKLLASAQNPTERFEILKFITFGYALGGHFIDAKKSLDQAENSSQRFNLLKEIIWGCLASNSMDEAQKYFAFAQNPLERRALLRFLIRGYVLNRDVNTVDDIINAANDSEKPGLLREVIYAYAEYNHPKKAETFLANHPKYRATLLENLGAGYGKANNTIEINNKINELKSNKAEQKIFIQGVIHGYAFSGNLEAADNLLNENLLKRNDLILEMLLGFIIGGHISKAKTLLAENPGNWLELSNAMILECAKYGYLAEVETLLVNHPGDRTRLYSGMMHGFALAGNRAEIEKKFAEAPEGAQAGLLRVIVIGSVHSCHLSIAEWALTKASLAQQHELIRSIATSLAEKGIFLNLNSALSMLGAFRPDISKKLAHTLKDKLLSLFPNKTETEFDLFVNKAKQLYPLATTLSPLTYPINYRSRLGTSCAQIFELLTLTGRGLMKQGKLRDELNLICSFIAPISSTEANDLSMKLFERFSFLSKKTIVQEKRLLTCDSTEPSEQNTKRQKNGI